MSEHRSTDSDSDNDTATRHGGCLCGGIRFEARGEPLVVAMCHCPSCRRAAGAPAVAWAMYPEDQIQFTAAPRRFESSPGNRRGFCPDCGTSLSFEGDLIAGLIDVTVGAFDDPASLPPRIHIWDSHRLPWMGADDGLERFDALPPSV